METDFAPHFAPSQPPDGALSFDTSAPSGAYTLGGKEITLGGKTITDD